MLQIGSRENELFAGKASVSEKEVGEKEIFYNLPFLDMKMPGKLMSFPGLGCSSRSRRSRSHILKDWPKSAGGL